MERGYRAKEMSFTRILPARSAIRNLAKRQSRRPITLRESPAMPELAAYYDALVQAYGPQHWWPGKTRFEVIVGAILTQSTSWSNVELAIATLRRERLLSIGGIERVSLVKLARLIRSSGYFRQKARKLKSFVNFLRANYQGSLNKMFAVPTERLRGQLLGVHGIGPETADSILLYAGQYPVFVVDAYARRILDRHRLISGTEKNSYEEIRELFQRSLPADASLFNEYHALIVHTGKQFCHKSKPECSGCALRSFLPSMDLVSK